MLKINEVFYSIQGEGAKAGNAAIFVRFAGCNLQCSWCDTNHQEMFINTAQELAAKVRAYPEGAMVVLTGGEPMMQDRTLFRQFIDIMVFDGRFIAMETNGTIYDEKVHKELDWITVSPKRGTTVHVPYKDICELKYVMDNDLTLKDIPSKKDFNGFIYLQPMSQNEQSTLRCIDWVQKFPDRFTLSVQLHKYINLR